MAMIKCPDCGQNVSDRAQTCIHCGAPIVAAKNILKIRTPRDMNVAVKLKYIFTDDTTKQVLAEANQNQVVTLELDYPTIIRCHMGRGFRDGLLNYTPGGFKKYLVSKVNQGIFRTCLEFTEVDTFDSNVW